jgi:hypothetical protein
MTREERKAIGYLESFSLYQFIAFWSQICPSFCSLCDNGAGFINISASWHNVELCHQRALEGL